MQGIPWNHSSSVGDVPQVPLQGGQLRNPDRRPAQNEGV